MNWPQLSKYLFIGAAIFAFSCEKAPVEAPSGLAASTVVLAACDPEQYDLACMKDEKTATSDKLLDVLGGLKDEAIDLAADPVSDARQDEYGEASRTEIEREFPVIAGHPQQDMVQGMLLKLLRFREAPSDIDYNIYIVRSQMVNAFTVGGEIYITDALLKDVGSKDELACVIGHEIGHNELGHIAKQLKQTELAQGILGDETGATVAGFIGLLTIGFNQKNEAESDLYGIDLALGAGYDACRGIDFWQRMEANESEANELDNLMRSHPYSSKRAACYRSHIADFHHYACGE
jgi:predicted Zn-dependent protease